MNFSYFVSIVIMLLGISLIGTVLQSKIRVWKNSQNMFFGCIGGLIANFCGMSIVGSIIVIIICAVISWAIFKYCIKKDIFSIKSEKLKDVILFLAISIVFIGAISFARFDFRIIFRDPLLIMIFFIIVSGIAGIPKFIRLIKAYNPDEFEDGEMIYIVDSFVDKTQNLTEMYDQKKFHFESMHFIIDKECVVRRLNGKNVIILNGRSYFIREKNNEVIKLGDKVKISKENLDKGMIRENDSIIVEKTR